MQKRGQNWSIEVIIALSIFIVIIISMFLLFNTESGGTIQDLQQSGNFLLNTLIIQESAEDSDDGVFRNNVLDVDRLEALSEYDLEQLKEEFGIDEDFCIIIESANGSILAINDSVGIGSSNILIEGTVACNATIIP